MATLTTWTLSKRNNSTKTPSGAGNQIDVTLKGGCDILAPVFVLNFSGIPSFNYCLFQARYYFVSDIKSVRQDLWEVSCNIDLLGTYKANIQASSPYVLYYTHNNTEISDHRLSVKTTQVTQSNTAQFGFLGNGEAFMLTVIGDDNTATFALNRSQLMSIFAQDYQTAFDYSMQSIQLPTGTGFADTLTDCVRFFCDFLQESCGAFNYAGTVSDNIKSCVILPVQIGAIGGTPNTPIVLGKIDTGVRGLRVTDRTFTDSCTVSIPWQASDWRRNAPYHEVFVYIPALGLVSLSPSDLVGESSITVKLSMDVLSGDTIFEVKTSTKTVYYSNTNLATQYALGSSQTNYSGLANTVIAGAAALTGNPIAMAGSALGLANALQPNPLCIGSNSGGAILGINANDVSCITIFHDTTVTPSSISAEKGTPYNGVLSLSGITGYVQTMGASVAGALTDTERERINQLMDGGFFIE